MTKISNLYALTNYIYVNSSGTAIGIGTTTPASKLEVAGDVTAHGALTLGSGYAITFKDPGTIGYTGIEGSSYNQSYSFLAFTTGGSEKVRIDSSGNFGIGVAIPSYKLDVNGTARISGAISGTSASFSSSITAGSFISDGVSSEGSIRIERDTVSTSTVIGSLNFTNNNGATTYGKVFGGRNSAGDGYVALGTGVSNNLYALENGNIGIGTASPIAYQNYRYLQIDGASTTQGGVVRLRTSDGSYTNEFAVDSGGGYISSSGAFQIYVNNSPRLYINTSGSVGIGTTSPQSLFDVTNIVGTAYNPVNTLISGQTMRIANTSTTSGVSANLLFIATGAGGGNGLGSISGVNTGTGSIALTFGTRDNGGNVTERMRIASNGYVGIGTTSPYSPLTVVGNTISWGETATFYPSSSGYTTLAFRLEGTDTTTGTWAIGKESSTGGNTTTQFLQVAKNSLTGSALYRPDAVQAWNVNGDTSFGFRVLRPAQPAFLAYSGSGGFTVTPGSWYNISTNLTVESYDIGSNYSSGRFTAPVAGRYLFYAGGWTSVSSNGERYAWSAIVNGGSQTFIAGGNFCITDSPLSPYSIVYNLAAGDYVDLHLFSAVGGTFGAGTHRVYWGGYLL